jgi:hypothetical protein
VPPHAQATGQELASNYFPDALYVIYYVVGMFIKGQLLNIIGIILGLVFLLYALRAFHVVTI